jgi:chaperone LolA
VAVETGKRGTGAVKREIGVEVLVGLAFGLVLCITHAWVARADEPAEKVLEQVKEKYEDIQDAEIRFSQKVKFSMTNIEQENKGTLIFKKGNKYRVEFDEQTIVTDGETVWSYSPSRHQVLVDRFKLDERAMTPERVLVQAPTDYTSSLLGKEKLGKIDAVILKLVPRDENAMVTAMKIWVNEQDWMLRKVEISDLTGKLTTYTVSSIKVNTGIPDSRFVFQVPEGVEVVDLR